MIEDSGVPTGTLLEQASRITPAITASVVFHGLSTAPLSGWLGRREPAHEQRSETRA